MRPLLKYSVPIAGGLAAAGYAASQGEDPGSALLAGIAGGAGAAGGLVGARALAGKYAPVLGLSTADAIGPMAAGISTAKAKAKPGGLKESILEGALGGLLKAGNYAANPERPTGKLFAAGLVPASAALAGLGGVAAGAIPGSMGVPGFQQQVVDPESYGSSNSPGARYKAPTMQYV